MARTQQNIETAKIAQYSFAGVRDSFLVSSAKNDVVADLERLRASLSLSTRSACRPKYRRPGQATLTTLDAFTRTYRWLNAVFDTLLDNNDCTAS